MKKREIEAVIFDFDGVIANTDLYHFIAWKKAVRLAGINMDQSVQHHLRGLTRQGTLQKVLELFNVEISEKTFIKILDKKNDIYKEIIEEVTAEEVLPGIIELLKHLKEVGYKTAIASVSRNSETIIKNIGLSKYFDVIVDPSSIEKMKPAPDIFIKAAQMLEVAPWKCVGIEDSQVGIDSINASLMRSVCIDFHNNIENCLWKLSSTSELTPESFEKFVDSINK